MHRDDDTAKQEIFKEFKFEVRIKGKVRAPGPKYAESQIKAGVMLSLNIHDIMDDFAVIIVQDPWDRLREGLK